MTSPTPEYRYELPWPPSNNRYYRNLGDRVLISREGRRYGHHVQGIFWEKRYPAPMLIGRLALRVIAFPPNSRRRDLDNLWKALLDTLRKVGVYKDDDQIDKKAIERDRVVPEGKVIVYVQEIADAKCEDEENQ